MNEFEQTSSGLYVPKKYEIYIKPSENEISQRKLESYLKLAQIKQWGIKNPTKFMSIFLGVDLLDAQEYVFMNSWTKPFALWLESRAAGKSTMLALYSMVKGLLFNNYRIYICSGTADQSQETFKKIEDIALKNIESMLGLTDVFKNEVEISQSSSNGFIHNPMGFTYSLYNGSFVRTLNSNIDAKRGRTMSTYCWHFLLFKYSKGERIIMIKIKNYTDEDISFLMKNFENMSLKQIAEKLHKTESSIYYVSHKLKLGKQIHNKWTDNEICFLKSNYINMTSEEISQYINHSIDAINTMRDRLNLVRNKSWSEDEINILKNNFESMMFVDLSKLLGRTEGALRAKCFELNLFKNNPWDESEIEFVRNNYMEMPTSEISERLNRTCDAIQLKARRLGLKKYPYMCDYHYFDEINTEEKAYWLGFLSADGWINKSKNTNAGVTGIELQYGDINHLRKFNKSINGNYQITDRWRPCVISTKDPDKLHHMCTLRIFSMIMYESLVKLGFSNNKSYDFHIPDLRQDLVRHYVRGYFDGDGCLCYTNQSFSLGFETASEILNNDLIFIIQQQHIRISTYDYINDFGTTMYRGSINRNDDKIKFLDWIYKDCNIYLDRKYKKYLKVKEKQNSNVGLAS